MKVEYATVRDLEKARWCEPPSLLTTHRDTVLRVLHAAEINVMALPASNRLSVVAEIVKFTHYESNSKLKGTQGNYE